MILFGRTMNWHNFIWFENETNIVAVELTILVQYAFELVALTL